MLNDALCDYFFAGNVVIYRTNHFYTTTPGQPTYCNPTLYEYAFWLTTSFYILIGTSCCCFCFCGFLASLNGADKWVAVLLWVSFSFWLWNEDFGICFHLEYFVRCLISIVFISYSSYILVYVCAWCTNIIFIALYDILLLHIFLSWISSC